MTPISVQQIRFAGSTGQDGPGLNVSSSVTAMQEGARHGHVLYWLPWHRVFRLEWIAGPKAVPEVFYIPVERVSFFKLLDGEMPEAPRKK